MTWWWLTFADARKPRGSQHLGVSIVEADDFFAAVQEANRRQLNPGGEVRGYRLDKVPEPSLQNRALTREEIYEYGVSTRKDIH